ncbi:Nucleoid occlusion protein [Saliniradius amylolyticus]|uniref:Probable chromosome-partitioning protein ParB n=1 Tax=Saliniradius amylolyticus TaxID=2183582 RepID=A0A2S2E711_9ALTE|nr:ParB/RepB/Spo0J family partition protein [Saliniradius amylolyticus]AWL13443.1 Nucleoid occlusion protein [Saliniradius amylolyticus]
MSSKKRGLGRGLDALLATSQSQAASQDADASGDNKGELRKLPIEFLCPGKYQPRKDMSPEALEDLASSIRSQGVIQPIVVRPLDEQDRFEIIAGERRWRAAQLAELDVVPCLIKEVPDEAAVAIALIENIQREDLNAMEEAMALQRLINEFELTHQQVADSVGKSRTSVTNILRLNHLNEDVKKLLEYGDIEMGHARALLALEGDAQTDAARTVAGKGMTVRDAEKLVRKMLDPEPAKAEKPVDPDIQRLENELTDNIGAAVSIKHNPKGRGKMTINYTSLDELDGIISRLQKH